jgi:hypothetical protein
VVGLVCDVIDDPALLAEAGIQPRSGDERRPVTRV